MIGQKGIPALYGGVERHVEELASLLVKKGYQVSVYTRPYYTPKDKKEYRDIKLVSLPSLHSKHLDAISHTFFATCHAIKRNADVFHYHGVGPSLLSFLPRIFRPRAKVITTFHCVDRHHQKWGGFARLMLHLGEWTSLHFAHQTIVVSESLKKYCQKKYRQEPIYIPNGANSVSDKEPSIIEKEFGLEKEQYILFVGRFVRHKGVHHLIKSYQALKTDLKLVLVGDSSFTDKYVEYTKSIAKGDPNIIFTGYQTGPALEELFSNAYLYVQPSESEGLPISLLEAASYGRCLLASNIPENVEIVKHCGLSFKNKNITDLAKQLSYLIEQPELINELGKKARKHVLSHYNWQEIADKIHQCYLNPKIASEEPMCATKIYH